MPTNAIVRHFDILENTLFSNFPCCITFSVNACLKALDQPNSGFTAYHIIGSIQARDNFDIERTEKELGLAFKARFESFK